MCEENKNRHGHFSPLRDREVILKIKETHVLGHTIYKGSDLPLRHTRPALVLLAVVFEAINRADHGFK